MALKASTGAILLFHHMGDAANGVQWSEQGQSDILKDDYALFAGKRDWDAEYHFSESSAGKRAEYEARKKKLEDMRKAEEDARRKKDAKLAAEKKAERRREEQAELAARAAGRAAALGRRLERHLDHRRRVQRNRQRGRRRRRRGQRDREHLLESNGKAWSSGGLPARGLGPP